MWKKIFNQNVAKGLFIDEDDVKMKHSFDVESPLYSFLDSIDTIPHLESPYHFKLCYPELTEYTFPCNEWTQIKNPMKVSTMDGIGYVDINTTFHGGSFNGIAKNKPGSRNEKTILDTTPTETSWWYAIGALAYDTAKLIPGPMLSTGPTAAQGKKVSLVELFLKKTPAPPPPGRSCYETHFVDSFSASGRKKRSIGDLPLNFAQFELGATPNIVKRGAVETHEKVAMRSYGSRLRYECGLGRKFLDDFSEQHYDEKWLQCNWNKTWTRTDTLDKCDWVQCLYPPEVMRQNLW